MGPWAGFGVTVLIAAAGALLGYQIGGMIAENNGMSPGQTEAFLGAMMGVGFAERSEKRFVRDEEAPEGGWPGVESGQYKEFKKK